MCPELCSKYTGARTNDLWESEENEELCKIEIIVTKFGGI